MSSGEPVLLERALVVANELVLELGDVCERIEIAGSIRRGRLEVRDVELLVVPKIQQEAGLFDSNGELNLVVERIWQLRQRRVLEDPEHPAGGDRYHRARHVESGLGVDVFMVRPPASWGCLFLIRTGSADYARWMVTNARDRRVHFTEGALHRGALGCIAGVACEVIPTPEEADVYAALDLQWVAPQFREIAPRS